MSAEAARPWIRSLRPDARLRLICLPYAGGGTAEFRTWADGLPGAVDVCPVVLPGRETRLSERPYDDLHALVEAMLPALAPATRHVPWAVYGHSFGSWVAFEWLRALRRLGRPLPVALFVGARRAPHLPPRLPPLSGLPDAAFVQGVQERYGAIPPAIRDNPDILSVFLPTLRADFALLDRYRYQDEPPLPVPILALRGEDDPIEPRADVEAWSEHAGAGFEARALPGGHFFLRESRDLLTDLLSARLRRHL